MPVFLFNPAAWPQWQTWFSDHGLRLLGIALGLLVTYVLFRKVISRMLSGAIARGALRVPSEDRYAIRRRADTLAATLNWAVGVLLGFLGLGFLLSELGMNVSALIAGVGVVGLGVGLGAQTLVRDVLNGLFILIEDQYAVGDTVTVAGATGEVIEINPRRTVIRDESGNVHSIPNSAVVVAVNRSPGLARFKVSVVVDFRSSDRAQTLCSETIAAFAEEAASLLAARPKVADQSVLPGGEVSIILVGEARAGQRWDAEADLRRRLKRSFDAENLDARIE